MKQQKVSHAKLFWIAVILRMVLVLVFLSGMPMIFFGLILDKIILLKIGAGIVLSIIPIGLLILDIDKRSRK